MNFIKKILIGFFIFSLVWPQTSLAIQLFDYPSPVESMNQIMTDLGVDKEEIKKNIDSTLNVASLKKPAPDVKIIFVPESPQAGKEITAVATPGNFVNDVKKMYFTWFLKHNTSAPESEDAFGRITKHGNTDWNNDGDINIEDYKIEAARILAKGDWEPDYASKVNPATGRPIAEMADDRNENGSLEDERYNRYYEVVRDTDNDDYEASFGGEDQKGKPAHCYMRNIESGEDSEIDCEHLFPENSHEIGDGKFGKSEEKFWGTDPESEDTDNDGIIDEKALTGMGTMSLRWIYKKGDRVGVAVEGISENTDYKDSSMKTMWAFPRTDDGSDDCGATFEELNECLEENMIDPALGTKAEKIDVALSYSPQYPINDERGQNETLENNSDELKIKADLTNIEDESFVKYDWKFWLCPGNGEDCFPRDNQGVSFPDGMTPKQLLDNLGLVKKSGLGLDSVNLKLQIDDDDPDLKFEDNRYLKAELRVLETTEQTEGKSGKAVVLIPLQETDRDIVPKEIKIIENPRPGENIITQTLTYLGLKQNNRYSNLKTDCPNKTCPVVKNEIIGLEFNGVADDQTLAWSLNGKPLMASGENSEIVYFPILEGAGYKYSVKLDIIERTSDEKEEKFSLARDFLVKEPGAHLRPINCDPESGNPNCRSVLLGKRILDETNIAALGATEQDFSQDLFQAKEAETIAIAPNFNFNKETLRNTNNTADQADDTWQIQWIVDGTAIAPQDTEPFPNIDPLTGNLNLPINKSEGEKYTVSAEALYTQPDTVRRALYKIWNVPPESFYEKKVGDTLEIEVIDINAPLVRSGTKKIMASIFSEMPSYLNFLFRTVLTLALILFMANLSFILFPKQGRS